MTYYSGNSGKIKFVRSDTELTDNGETGWKSIETRIQNWTLNTSANLLDSTHLGCWDKKSEYGLRTTTGNFRVFYYIDDKDSTVNNTQSQPKNNAGSWFINALLRAATSAGEADLPPYPDISNYLDSNRSLTVRLRLYLREPSTNVRDFFDFDANLTSISVGMAVNELTMVDVNYEATGQIRRSNA